PNEDVREAGGLELASIAEAGLGEKDALRALEAATRTFPPRKIVLQDGVVTVADSAADLVRAAAFKPRLAHVTKVLELFPRFAPEAKVEALDLLARMPEREAAEAYVYLVKNYGGEIPRLPIATLQCELQHADVFFPILLDLADDPVLGLDV